MPKLIWELAHITEFNVPESTLESDYTKMLASKRLKLAGMWENGNLYPIFRSKGFY